LGRKRYDASSVIAFVKSKALECADRRTAGQSPAADLGPLFAMLIRPARQSDIPEMHRVRMCVRENVLRDPSAVTPEHTREMLVSRGRGRGWVCEIDGRIVGFAVGDLRASNVWALFVEPGYEGRGIGRQLHDAMLDWMFESGAERIWLSTDGGTRAERFYRRAGWQAAGMQPNGELRFEMSGERWASRCQE